MLPQPLRRPIEASPEATAQLWRLNSPSRQPPDLNDAIALLRRPDDFLQQQLPIGEQLLQLGPLDLQSTCSIVVTPSPQVHQPKRRPGLRRKHVCCSEELAGRRRGTRDPIRDPIQELADQANLQPSLERLGASVGLVRANRARHRVYEKLLRAATLTRAKKERCLVEAVEFLAYLFLKCMRHAAPLRAVLLRSTVLFRFHRACSIPDMQKKFSATDQPDRYRSAHGRGGTRSTASRRRARRCTGRS